ncbi:Holliday junction branch migration protein RuvA [Thalassospira xianhensis]|uniref:Holliday junction branch migration complex subunit RuvA n=1 Tax=Thalassospira xianhensis MCCC 1A02616 TaxID=1177929 RepID=A0A367UHI5_9PROT|nr:Holliday junction branch migration protein RuvA [Thalassospira xianhensis]RCK07766.1 hypothetical protein TH5_01595 [Thalassospira xianhensis MCCC 1A02616]
MIAYLSGRFQSRNGNSLVITVNGVGYLVHVSTATLGSLAELGQEIELVIQTIVKEDAITLYGFRTDDEREVFQLLTSVQGIGPSAALSILSLGSCADIVGALASEDENYFAKANRVGKKTAGRLVVELKAKAAVLARGIGYAAGSSGSTLERDAQNAMRKLGFGNGEIAQRFVVVREQGPLPESVSEVVAMLLRVPAPRVG